MFRGENRVREIAAAGKTEYTIVRAGRLGDVETQGAMVVGQTNTGLNNYLAIARKDVAAVLVECPTSAKVKNTTFELGAAKGAQPCAVSTLLDGLPHTGDSWLAQTKKSELRMERSMNAKVKFIVLSGVQGCGFVR
jgi:hypothetical protein